MAVQPETHAAYDRVILDIDPKQRPQIRIERNAGLSESLQLILDLEMFTGALAMAKGLPPGKKTREEMMDGKHGFGAVQCFFLEKITDGAGNGQTDGVDEGITEVIESDQTPAAEQDGRKKAQIFDATKFKKVRVTRHQKWLTALCYQWST